MVKKDRVPVSLAERTQVLIELDKDGRVRVTCAAGVSDDNRRALLIVAEAFSLKLGLRK